MSLSGAASARVHGRCSWCSPTIRRGSYVKRWELERLNIFCREHQLALIADEVFLDYAVESGERLSFCGNREALSFTLSGLSKISGLPQMKIRLDRLQRA